MSYQITTIKKQAFSTVGSNSWVCPTGVTSVNAQVWGAGGAGWGNPGGNGGYTSAYFNTTPGLTYIMFVGGGGTTSTAASTALGGFVGGGAVTVVGVGSAGGGGYSGDPSRRRAVGGFARQGY